ncbi:MAG: class I SAM-dependent methyltransferase [Chloroflexota bacterium]
MTIFNSIKLYGNLIRYQITSKSTRDYSGQWDSYWSTIDQTGVGGEVLWDNVPQRAAEEDLARFIEHMDKDLPILDLGSGNGRQSRFLAQHFTKVVGVDVSAHAIQQAQQESAAFDNIEFRVFDATEPAQAQALHNEFGDMNIYMRGVFHVIQKPDRANFVSSLQTLLGRNGTLYQIELTGAALSYFRTLPGDSPSGLPKLLHKVVEHGITPIGFDLKDIHKLYRENAWHIIDKGHEVTINTVPLSHGQEGNVPANYLIVRPAHT